MKLYASTQNVFSMNTVSPLARSWDDGATRRASFAIRPFGSEDAQQIISQRDELDRKQEVVCAAILGLSLFSTVATCLWQLARL